MQSITFFDTAQAARNYRHSFGTGGWIFEDEADGSAILFPPDVMPVMIFHHPMTRGKSGRLIGSG